MSYRKFPLVQGEIYHVFTKSIAGFKIFNNDKDYVRMIEELRFYREGAGAGRFSLCLKSQKLKINYIKPATSENIVSILAYCLMPTHIHLVLKQLKDDGISKFVNLILKSYSGYFNIKHGRKGPLWESRFKNVLVETEEQFLHLSRYIHLNPVSSYLINAPQDWQFSSYSEYINLITEDKKICNFSEYLNMEPTNYKRFVESRIDYQRRLEQIKHLLLE